MVKICKDDGDGIQYRSLQMEQGLLSKMKDLDHIVQMVDYIEDAEGTNTAYLVLEHAGSEDLENLINSTNKLEKRLSLK